MSSAPRYVQQTAVCVFPPVLYATYIGHHQLRPTSSAPHSGGSPSDVSVFPKVFVDAHEFTDRDWKFQLLGGTERVEAKFVPEPSHWSRIAQRVQTQI